MSTQNPRTKNLILLAFLCVALFSAGYKFHEATNDTDKGFMIVCALICSLGLIIF